MRNKRILAFAAVVLAILAFTSCKFISDMIVAEDLATNLQEISYDMMHNRDDFAPGELWSWTEDGNTMYLNPGQIYTKSDSNGNTFRYSKFEATIEPSGKVTIGTVFRYDGRSHEATMVSVGENITITIDGSRYDL